MGFAGNMFSGFEPRDESRALVGLWRVNGCVAHGSKGGGRMMTENVMKTSEHHLELVILRIPAAEGNFLYQIAKVPRKDAECVERLATAGCVEETAKNMFSLPLTLSEAMQRIDTRDYRVIDRDSTV